VAPPTIRRFQGKCLRFKWKLGGEIGHKSQATMPRAKDIGFAGTSEWHGASWFMRIDISWRSRERQPKKDLCLAPAGATLRPPFSPALCCAEPKSLAGFVKECISILNV
jgi:hypothetical protein